ncbi:5-carboxymethyl-2-hydroxymuconate Delta-isomerase [Allosphingosinicella vermicomposti]|uniref:5-carboxymethyl-2-hydroxymuconate Delta-isomerase n=1 Tax=Allosphingosinicella vermicomposti TaxID=614671 RepID=UPI0018F8A91E|nr:hypothetical protein [Allosphingosinicella vermicomposti]
MMPQIMIEQSRRLAGLYDSRALALAIHHAAVDIIETTLESCKTRIVTLDETVIGAGDPENAMLHIDFRGLSGRTPDQKAALGRAILALAGDALPRSLSGVQLTVEIRDLDRENYHKKEYR